jgi:hypothetical protein
MPGDATARDPHTLKNRDRPVMREDTATRCRGRMPDMWIGKLLSLAGVILLLLAVSPMGDFWDPRQSRLANAWRWIRNPRPDLATPVTVDPIFLYGGGLCAIIGILLG